MDIKKQFGTDEKKELEGVVHDLGEGAKVRVARIGNPKFKLVFNRLTKPHKQMMQRGTLPEATGDSILIRAMAETILLDWEGIEEDGTPVEYNKEEVIRLLTEYKDFRDLIANLASDMDSFKSLADEELKGN